MYFIPIFFGQLVLLFILSRFVTGDISHFVYRLTKSSKIAVYTLSFLFLPGTIIHELSHYLTAQLLFVRTGEMEFVPKIHEDRVKLGSVQIEKTDPIRRALIGVAPFLLGTSLLLLVLFAAEFYDAWGNIWITILIGYLVFEIGNTMFSSKKDMEGVLELLVVILIVGVILYFTGVRIPASFFDFLSSPFVVSLFEKGSYFLLLPIIIDIFVIILTRLLLRFLR
jgi:hypothetical protein